jgi:asparagine synthase (glutamine-hydrolysing)
MFNGHESSVEFASRLLYGFGESQRIVDARNKLGFLSGRARNEQGITLRLLGNKLSALLHRNDRMGMMSSIEARFPYLDEDLIKFSINLPARFKIGRSVRWHNYKHPFLIDKWVIRALAEKYLPRGLAFKKKKGFPMYGHKNVRVRPSFFKNGWLEQNLKIRQKDQEYMVETEDPYYIAKVASVEIFGRIFGMGSSVEDVRSHVLDHITLIDSTVTSTVTT